MRYTKQELFPAIPEQPVERTRMAHHMVRELRQRLVTDKVAVPVIDHLEPVDIHHDDHAAFQLAPDQFVLLTQFRQHAHAAAGAGQRIDIVDLVFQLPLQRLDQETRLLQVI